MNFQKKYKQNEKFIKNFIELMPEMKNYDDMLKLSEEIGRLSNQNKRIKKMTFEEVNNEFLMWEQPVVASF